jgi:23S rRNA (cytidine2498-2'-O)-methyltransferase
MSEEKNTSANKAIDNAKDQQLILLCRPGLENDAAAEIMDTLALKGIHGFCKAKENEGWLSFHRHGGEALQDVLREVNFYNLIFVRQWFVAGPALMDIDPANRIDPINQALDRFPAVSEVVMETLDTNDGKELSRLANSLQKPLMPKLRKFKKNSIWRAHILLLSGTHFVVGVSTMDNSAPWPGGIPRLRFLRDAPSRSALKLEEAMHWFFNKEDWAKTFEAADHAIDLGAAPGGWTWQLTQRGMNVISIDNGPMNEDLMNTGFVKHIRTDAFTYQPSRTMSWMVCDIVDKPARVAELVERWFIKGFCRRSIFNLKLPMKQRYRESKLLLEKIRERCEKHGVLLELRAKQLYHDREEITVFAERMQTEILFDAELASPSVAKAKTASAKAASKHRDDARPKPASRSQAREKPPAEIKTKREERAKIAAKPKVAGKGKATTANVKPKSAKAAKPKRDGRSVKKASKPR